MTYKESYLALNSIDEILKKVEYDVLVAMFINKDRIPIIRKSAEEAILEKFGEDK